MSLFSFLFKKKGGNSSAKSAAFGATPIWSPFFSQDSTPELNITFMNCVRTNATNFGKIMPKCFVKDQEVSGKAYLNRILQYKPNPRINGPKFWRAVGRSYFYNNLAIIFPEWDFTKPNEPLKALWPIDLKGNAVQFVITKDGSIAVHFYLNGADIYEWLDDLIVLERDVDVTGDFNGLSPDLDQSLAVLKTFGEGAINAILSAFFVQYICSISTNVDPEVLKARQKDMDALWFDGKSRVIFVNGGDKLERIEPKASVPMSDTIETFKKDVYQYEGTNEKIVNRAYDEDDWQAYFEGTMEPLCQEVSAELTNKLLSEYEFFKGNKIEVITDPLQTASLARRAQFAQILGNQAVVIPNELRRLLYLPPIPDGDKPQTNLNYVHSDKQDQYQDVSGDDSSSDEKPDNKSGSNKKKEGSKDA